ncbi:MAG: universal stress protein, partial [Segetibacter sp.]|nr:universal stress protein [Segetibacter sp.]
LHVCQPILSATDMVVVMTEEELMESSEKLLRKEVAELPEAADLSVEFFVEEGLPSEVIKWVAKSVKAKWMVIGMKGGGGIMRKIFGSTAISLSRNPNFPLILVPPDARFTPPKTIALASDIGDETNIKILDPLEEFGIQFNSTMYVVRVIKNDMNEVVERLSSPLRIKSHFKNLNASFDFISDNSVTHAMNEFVKENRIDMMAMIAHEHNILERIFVKSNIKEMLFRSHVPLIILPGKVNVEYAEEVDESISIGKVE